MLIMLPSSPISHNWLWYWFLRLRFSVLKPKLLGWVFIQALGFAQKKESSWEKSIENSDWMNTQPTWPITRPSSEFQTRYAKNSLFFFLCWFFSTSLFNLIFSTIFSFFSQIDNLFFFCLYHNFFYYLFFVIFFLNYMIYRRGETFDFLS